MNKCIKYIASIGAFALILGTTIACSEEEPIYVPPTFKLNEVKDIMRTGATFSGSITGDMSKIKEYGFQYSLSEDFTASLTKQIVVGETPSSSLCEATVKDLEANERYYYRLYATTGISKVYSETEYFQTAQSSAPIMSALMVDSIGENVIRFKCTIEEIGDEYLIEYGVGYKKPTDKSYNPIPSDSIVPQSIAGTPNTFVVEITGLEPATKYSFRPYAKNSADPNGDTGTREGYGTIIEKQTENQLSAVVETAEIMEGNIGINSVTVSGLVESAVGSDGVVDVCGFCWSATNETPSIIDSHMEVDVAKLGEYFTGTITDLQPGMTYYVRAYAKNTVNGSERIGYGVVYEITTANLVTPILEWATVKDEWGNNVDYSKVTPSSISVRANIKNYDESALIEKGLIWDKVNGELSIEQAKKNKTYLVVNKGGNVIDGIIEKLQMNTTYYIRAYAIYKAADLEEVGYTPWSKNLRTEGFYHPNLDNVEIPEDNITRNSAQLIGKISSNGNGKITERGFCLSLVTNTYQPTIDNCDIHVKSNETFISEIKNLNYHTEYAVRSYVISKLENETDTTYCGWRTCFWTKDLVLPTFNNVAVNDEERTSTSIPISSKIVSVGDGQLVEKGFIWSYDDWSVTLENALGSKKVDGEKFEAIITKLTPSTNYKFRAYAKVKIDNNEFVSYSDSENYRTQNVKRPDVDFDYDNMTSDLTSMTVAMKVNEKGEGTIVERGFCWKEYKDDWDLSLESNDGTLVVSDTINYVGTITNLLPSTGYIVNAYMKLKIDNYEYVYYSGTMHTSTQGIHLDLNISEILDTSCKVVGNTGDLQLEGVTEYGFCWSTENVNASEMKNQIKASEPDENGDFTATIEKLKGNTQYYVGMYIVYNDKKYYANGRWQFTTKRIPGINDNISPDKKD